MRKYHFYEDPGHGWLKVKKSDLVNLGIADKITGYSYMRGDDVFLEEDQDATTFFNSLNVPDFFNKWVITHISNKQSKIRNYSSYKNYTKGEEDYISQLKTKIINIGINWSAKALKQINHADLDTLSFWREHYTKQGYSL